MWTNGPQYPWKAQVWDELQHLPVTTNFDVFAECSRIGYWQMWHTFWSGRWISSGKCDVCTVPHGLSLTYTIWLLSCTSFLLIVLHIKLNIFQYFVCHLWWSSGFLRTDADRRSKWRHCPTETAIITSGPLVGASASSYSGVVALATRTKHLSVWLNKNHFK